MLMQSGTQTQDLILASLPIDPRFKEALIFKASYLVSVWYCKELGLLTDLFGNQLNVVNDAGRSDIELNDSSLAEQKHSTSEGSI